MTKLERRQTKAWLQSVADRIVGELGDLTYEQWVARPERETYERDVEGAVIQVEVGRIELTPRYVHIAIRVDDGRAPFVNWPVGTSFIVERLGFGVA